MQPEIDIKIADTYGPNSAQEAVQVDDVAVKTDEKPSAEVAPNWKNVATFTGASFNSTVINIINTIIGAGILSIAFSIMKAGIVGSVILIAVILVPSLLTAYYLSAATIYTNESVYGVVGSKLCHVSVGALADFTLLLLNFGIDVAYMNVLFNQIIDIAKEVFNIDLSANKTLISVIISIVILFPLCSIKTMDALKFTSAVAFICVIIFVVACIYMGFEGFSANKADLNMWPVKSSDLSSAFAVFVLCFCSHVNIPKITSEQRFSQGKSKFMSKARKTTKATIVAYIVCALSYLFVGVCGYMAFGKNISGSILDAMRGKTFWFKPIIRVGYGFVVMFSYPLLGFPGCCTIDAWVFKTDRTFLRRIIQGFMWVMATLLVSILVPELSDIFGVTGSFCGVLIVFVWPAVYFIAMCRKEEQKPIEMKSPWFKHQTWEKYIAYLILVIGLIVCAFATSLEVMGLIKK